MRKSLAQKSQRLTERHYLTRAASLLFHPDSQQYFAGASVKIGYFESNADLRYQGEIEANLLSQVSQVIEVLKSDPQGLRQRTGPQRTCSAGTPIPEIRLESTGL